MSNDIMQRLPNQLTVLRVMLVPVFLILIFFDNSVTNVLSAIVFVVASLTDFIDGYLARKYRVVSDFGKILDPIADKILVAAALISLIQIDRLNAVVVIILLSREFAVGALRDFASSKGIIIPAGFFGKIKTAFQMTALTLLIYKNELFGVNVFLIGKILIYLSVIISLYSGFVYYRNFFRKKANV